MKVTIGQVGKTYSVDSEDKVTVTHNHDSIVSVSGEYFKNKRLKQLRLTLAMYCFASQRAAHYRDLITLSKLYSKVFLRLG